MRGGRDGEAPGGLPEIAAGTGTGGEAEKAGQQGASVGGGDGGHRSAGVRRRPARLGPGVRGWEGLGRV